MDDWTPPSEEELKLLEARRARSDQISKLMSGYLLKGYKMLGSECTICGTILLQDRSNVKHCVACEELECDTDKDNPALRPPGAPSHIVKDEPRILPTTSASTLTTSATCSPRVAPKTVSLSPRVSCGITGDAHHQRGAAGDEAFGTEYLSMSSIDVHCWPANSADLLGGARSDQASVGKTNQEPAVLQSYTTSGAPDSGATAALQTSCVQQQLSSSKDITTCLPVLQAKICWASQMLEQNASAESSTELCKLIKAAAEAIVAVRRAST